MSKKTQGDLYVEKKSLSVDLMNYATLGSRSLPTSLQKALAKYTLDAYQKDRQKRGKCKACFYLRGINKITGRAMTRKHCANLDCEKLSEWQDTDTPAYCTACSEKHYMCRSCGGDLELRDRTTLMVK